jgi:hypothetical protein
MAMRRTVLLVTLLAAMLLVACGGDDDDAETAEPFTGITTQRPTPRPEPATTTAAPTSPGAAAVAWAREFCEATGRFDAVVASLEDGVDPRSLPLDERVERGVRRYEQHIAGLREVQAQLSVLTPLPEAETYQRATIEQTAVLIDILSESIEFLLNVDTHEAIDEELQEMLFAVGVVEEAVRRIEEQTLSPATRDALRSVPFCGTIVG